MDVENRSSRHYKEHHRHKKHKRKNRSSSRSRTRSRSQSRTYSPAPKRSIMYRNGKTASEYEIRIQALSTQLAMANSQLVTAETSNDNMKKAKTQAENRSFFLQQENRNLEQKNSEVMKTLEAGVEILQKEKDELVSSKSTLMENIEAQNRNIKMLDEQISSLHDRNSTLSKKCVDLLEVGKDVKEKCAQYEQELERIKLLYENLQKQTDDLVDENQKKSSQISIFEIRELNWMKIKSDLERRAKEEGERAERAERYVHQRLAATIDDSFKRIINVPGEHVYIEHMKKLERALESIRSLHREKMEQTNAKLKGLETLMNSSTGTQKL